MAISTGSAGAGCRQGGINVTPMIDVMLVLLIIFMIVTPLIAAGFKATLPKGKNLDPRPEGENEVVLGIDAGGQYFLNGRPVAGRHARGPAQRRSSRPGPRTRSCTSRPTRSCKYAQDPGSGRDRPAGRRAGHGRHHRAEATAGLFGRRRQEGEEVTWR